MIQLLFGAKQKKYYMSDLMQKIYYLNKFVQHSFMIDNSVNQALPAHQILSASVSHPQGDMSYMPSKYSKAFNSYSRNQIKTIMPFIASISRTCSYGSLYPICKVLKAISKIFMLNEIEVIFLAYLIRETGWDIRDKIIYHNADNVQDIIYYSIDNLDYKRIILYLMISAYTVKFYLNESSNQILEEANKRCPNFKQIFQSWNKKHSVIITKINLRTLNTVYKKLYGSVKQDQPDFNIIVDAIIQISPAYNPEREKQNNQPKKKGNIERKETDGFVKKEQPTLKHDKSGFIAPPALFSSSGLLNMVALYQQPPTNSNNNQNNQNLSGLNPFMPFKSDRIRPQYLGILGSSVYGGIQGPNYDIKQDDDCGELVVGLHDGQSEQNIVFEQKPNNNMGSGFVPANQNTSQHIHIHYNNQQSPFYTSIINLTRRSSAHLIRQNNVNESMIGVQQNNNQNKVTRRQASIIKLESTAKNLFDRQKNS